MRLAGGEHLCVRLAWVRLRTSQRSLCNSPEWVARVGLQVQVDHEPEMGGRTGLPDPRSPINTGLCADDENSTAGFCSSGLRLIAVN